MREATLSAKNQIVIPREAREALGVKAGDKLLVIVRNGHVIMLQKPKSHQAAIHGLARGGLARGGLARGGLARGTYPKGYLRKERESWD